MIALTLNADKSNTGENDASLLFIIASCGRFSGL